MQFHSFIFLLFFPAVVAVYYIIPLQRIKMRNVWLLLASYVFYMNWHPPYALLLLATTLSSYYAARRIVASHNCRERKTWLIIGIVFSLGMLFIFKYLRFSLVSIHSLLQTLHISFSIPLPDILLPIGISFFTIQVIGYMIDVYRQTVTAEKDLLAYSLFVSFFPQLVAGPIERSKNMLPQIHQSHAFDYDNAMKGLNMMIWGYFLKLVLADRCGIYVDAVYNNLYEHNGGSYLIATFLFPFQLYGDFAGYSMIAIGAAHIMGFSLVDNFRRPYLATSLKDFWRRWHISLSTWFRDYVYIPLGGNRQGKTIESRNLIITFILSGLWHGASWTYLIWGFYHGILIGVESFFRPHHNKNCKQKKHFICIIPVFVAVALGLVIFRSESISDAWHMFCGMVTNIGVPYLTWAEFFSAGLALLILFTAEISVEYGWKLSPSTSRHWLIRHIYTIVMLSYILLFGVFGSEQFIYFQF